MQKRRRRAGRVLDVDADEPAVSRRSTSPIASTSRSRWPSLSEASSDAASSSLRRSSSSRSARPASVSAHGPHALVARVRLHRDQPVLLERAHAGG